MHKALYRKYRPTRFEDVIGQDHIVKTLKNQIANDNLGHAYIFSGTRGTGKTSTAKIFSRAINCNDLIDEEPCNECEICRLILSDSIMDIVEIDAASNNSVDDIRELRENVKYSPTNAKYKVYIIDEVHMLSQGAFNALLKTLEEPPSYAIFILATTEPQKIPATIISRCQKFDFKRVNVKDMTFRMKYICDKEDIKFDDKALNLIARNSQGALRDALSILDQCISFSDNNILYEDVIEILGTANVEDIFEIAKNIMIQNTKEMMRLVDEFIMWGKDIKNLIDDLLEHFRNIMICKVSDDLEDIISYHEELIDMLKEQSKNVSIDELIRIINILSKTQVSLKGSNNQRVLVEINLIKLSQPKFDESYEAIFKRIEVLEEKLSGDKVKLVSYDKVEEKVKEVKENIVPVNNELISLLEKNWIRIYDNILLLEKGKNLFSGPIRSGLKLINYYFELDSIDDILCIIPKDKLIFQNEDFHNTICDLVRESIKDILHKNVLVRIEKKSRFIDFKKEYIDKGEEALNKLVENASIELK